jgi:starch phosphorylase
MRIANPRLSELVTSRIGDGWLTDLEQLAGLEDLLEDAAFTEAWREVKSDNKADLAAATTDLIGLEVDPKSLFDVMVKRLHEYKRQLLKALHIIMLYQRLKANPGDEMVPRTFFFGAKAAPGYRAAKLIIKLINSIAEVVNNDPQTAGKLKVAFLPNFNVTLGQIIYPAADLSEQISMAGKEASGTGNMKFALNGAVTVGTLDGANIEIRERVGEENFYLFGLEADEVIKLKAAGYSPADYINNDEELRAAIESISNGDFSGGDRSLFEPIVRHLYEHDEYLVCADFRAYVDVQDQAAEAYTDKEAWTRMSILNCARTGFFSSDRTMVEYCRDIWDVPVSR